jgi:Asp-tRNA(Asn)/Glu-tRNA(Gln) amidotransferase A subunit family amidase
MPSGLQLMMTPGEDGALLNLAESLAESLADSLAESLATIVESTRRNAI